MDINNHAHSSGPSIFYNDDFRAIIEAHIEYLRTHSDTRTLYLEPHIVYKYEFDMYGLLMHYGIQPFMHWIILRMNGLYSLTNFPTNLSELLVPSEQSLNIIRQIYQTTHSIN